MRKTKKTSKKSESKKELKRKKVIGTKISTRKKTISRGIAQATNKKVNKKVKKVSVKNNISKKNNSRPTSYKKNKIITKKTKSSSEKKLHNIIESVKKKYRPPTKPPSEVTSFVKELQKQIPNAKISTGGSFAKGTHLKGTHDIDVFVRFPLGTNNEEMSTKLSLALPGAVNMHGSRDYYQIKRKKLLFEIVPVLDIKSAQEIKNVTDMSPLHVDYVSKKLTPAQKDDVRLAKVFCKAAGVYGAESHLQGFSGYTLELLIHEYKSFEKMLLALTKAPAQIIIDTQKHYSGESEIMLRLNESKIQGPLIIVDPLDKERNAAAAVSAESLLRLRERAAAFLTNPNKKFFETKIDVKEIKNSWKPHKVLFVQVETPKGREDIVGSRVFSTHSSALRLLKEHSFEVVHAEWRFNAKKSLCWYVLRETMLSATCEVQGPPSHLQASVDAFREAHAATFERKGRWHAIEPRKYLDAQAALMDAWISFKTKMFE